MNDLPEDGNEITRRVRLLEQRLEEMERRIDVLERPLTEHWPQPATEVESAALAAASIAAEPPAQPGNLFTVFGKALLGIAGAYVLRAIEETSTLPSLTAAAIGIVYAFLWLVWAARVKSGPQLTSAIYAGTSALILAPMLWELTLRFNVLPAVGAAVLICAFALAAIALTLFAPAAFAPRDLKPVLRVASIASAAFALALAIASHVFLPFVAVLLILAAVCEFVPGCERVPEAGTIIALAADAAIWTLIFMYYGGLNAREGYPALSRIELLAPGIAIFALFAASVGMNTFLRRRQIAIFAIVQAVISFLLAAVSVADFGQPRGTAIFGAICLLLSAVCYAAVFTLFARAPRLRNRNVFAAWSAALLLSGSLLCLPPLLVVLLLGTAALAAMGLSRQDRWKAFEFYGMAFLLAAAAASELPDFLVTALVGTRAGTPAVDVWFMALCAVLCYVLVKPRGAKGWIPRTLHIGFAALATGSVLALLVDGLVALTAFVLIPGPHHLALIRTVALCVAALLLVSGGARWRRDELTRLGYAAIALVAVKLVTEDLRHGHLAYIAASIFLVAFTLIAAPRVAHARQKA
jgi:hypothetical protein